jgi:hypothetical protein
MKVTNKPHWTLERRSQIATPPVYRVGDSKTESPGELFRVAVVSKLGCLAEQIELQCKWS